MKCAICGKEFEEEEMIPVSYKYGYFDSEPEEYACAECLDKAESIGED